MLQKDTLNFLRALNQNNNREWFMENKEWYEHSRNDFEQLVTGIINGIGTFDKEISYLTAKKCIFRIYRDVRFSPDKSPYKVHFGAVMRPSALEKTSGYYLHVSPEESFLTCGHYMLPAEELRKVRRGIYEDYDLFRSLVEEKNFKKEFGDLFKDDDMLKRVPNGFNKDHPAADYLRMKHFYVLKHVEEKELLNKDFVKHAISIYKHMYPLGKFLNSLLLD